MFNLFHYRPQTSLADMLEHTLVHMRDLALGEYAAFLVFSLGLFGLAVHLRRKGSFRFRIHNRLAKGEQARRELFNSSRAIVIYNATQVLMRVGVLAFGYVVTFDTPVSLPLAIASYPLIMIGHDAYFYFTHRLMHAPAIFRGVHWEHHRSKHPTVLAAYSFSITESVAQGFYPILYVMLFPCTFPTLIFFYFVAIAHDVMIHSGIDFMPRFLVTDRRFGWICGTIYHDIHHAVGRTNYGLYTRVWDRLFKTEHPDFVAIYDYVHSPQNDGNAYRKLLGRGAIDAAEDAPLPEGAPAS